MKANFGKVGELAANKLQNLLNDPVSQAKLSVAAINYLKSLYANTAMSDDDKAKQFIAAIEADIGTYVSAPSGAFGVTAGFAGSYSIMRLSWNRQTQRLYCQRQTCSCQDGTVVASPANWCYGYVYVGSGQYQYTSYLPSCTFTTDTVDSESQYTVYRNDKLLATYGELRKVASGQSLSGSFTFGFVNTSLNVVVPPAALDSSGKAGPFYDYDPYNMVLGQPLSYRVVASSAGCGAGYNNSSTGVNYGTESRIVVDADGDSRPDFYPADVLQQKRTAGPFVGTKINEHTDASGKVSIATFQRMAPAAQAIFTDFAVAVPQDYVVIGGGVEGTDSPQGHLLTASYPNGDLSSWMVSTKDHQVSNPMQITAWAIGLKINGLTRDQVRANVLVNTSTGPSVEFPDVAVGVPSDYASIGGGFKVNWTGAGNIATASYPDSTQTWRGKSKDHGILSPAPAQVYSIGIKRSIAGVGNIVTNIATGDSTYAAHPSSTAILPSGYALSGCGAFVNWSGAGNLLWKIKPVNPSTQHGCEAASKDHVYSSPATIRTYAIGIAVN